MGKPMSKAGAALRRAIRADLDASPSIDHLELRRKHKAAEGMVESAMTKTVAEWDAIIAATPDGMLAAEKERAKPTIEPPVEAVQATPAPAAMPGLEQGVVKFARKPAKMGMDFIFWIPRVYVKNGLVDPKVEYDVYLKKRA